VLVEKAVVAEESLAGLVWGAADADEDEHVAEDLGLRLEQVHVKVEELAAAFWAYLRQSGRSNENYRRGLKNSTGISNCPVV